MIDYTALKTEITTDPVAVGYASQLNKSDIAVAAMCNAITGNGAASIQIPSMSKGSWIAALLPLEDLVASGLNTSGVALSSGIIAKWTARIAEIRGGDSIIQTTVMIPLLNSAVTDGLITSTYLTQITTRMGSRAEALFGAGTTIAHQDVSKALGNWLKG